MPDDRLPKKLLVGQVKCTRPSGRPRLSYNDVASSDCCECRITRPYKDADILGVPEAAKAIVDT